MNPIYQNPLHAGNAGMHDALDFTSGTEAYDTVEPDSGGDCIVRMTYGVTAIAIPAPSPVRPGVV